ncbi:nucleoside deaminase [Carboxylicivirga sp. N1Y90]|uniref:nucleoside deaminase n=1 Tax=Carboxylicivirga fragile TaxID=3417571 RepID=UPI003D348C8B|nr:nucleoside deaminase [Marinilabiliaceae bacterium N1Y90]
MEDRHRDFMRKAIELSQKNVEEGGGPFGAVVVKHGNIIGQGVNGVTRLNDPTAHAEVNAIRDACKNVKSFDLAGCQIYTSCEPCPMCLGAIYWSRIERIYYANTKKDAASIGFDDQFIYDEIGKAYESRQIPFIKVEDDNAINAFNMWKDNADKIRY